MRKHVKEVTQKRQCPQPLLWENIT